ncbi:hypothetical protein EVAR_94213_1 [Eumeta japonica]|uniref:Uncharacterized protein n=1 Tax=Eumeta variegata TaxID=151549 RepID=A0A4C1UNA1_EUMVA|nr:hypothetical protein EVAR_94213_1 [Eumeta japonica]
MQYVTVFDLDNYLIIDCIRGARAALFTMREPALWLSTIQKQSSEFKRERHEDNARASRSVEASLQEITGEVEAKPRKWF